MGATEGPAKSIETALLWAIVIGLTAVVGGYGFYALFEDDLYVLMGPGPAKWPFILLMASTSAVSEYRRRRGKKSSYWPVALIVGGFIIIEMMLSALRK
jgi:hypothetical protein